MIISYLAPKGGVGSSTLALLTAVQQATDRSVLLIDAADDPSMDLYTSTENSVPQTSFEELSRTRSAVRDIDRLILVRLEPAAIPDRIGLENWLEEEGISEVVIDWSALTDESLIRAITISDKLIVVLTQDNSVLRAADRLLGTIRSGGGQAGFIINQWEDRDVRELGDRAEIFDLIEEDYYGSLSFDHELRFAMNRGKPLEVSSKIAAEIQEICAKIYQIPDFDDDPAAEEDPLCVDQAVSEVPDEPSPEEHPTALEQLPQREGVIARIRSFFRSGRG